MRKAGLECSHWERNHCVIPPQKLPTGSALCGVACQSSCGLMKYTVGIALDPFSAMGMQEIGLGYPQALRAPKACNCSCQTCPSHRSASNLLVCPTGAELAKPPAWRKSIDQSATETAQISAPPPNVGITPALASSQSS